ncbi:hypothetical protein AB1Y20_017912 [Prymnesium parvum]|uniref:Uncharacterized protein n=1 Tax=Prymnesium parvum TaxID=97485 RepID=A0AB34JMK7_PRYPA
MDTARDMGHREATFREYIADSGAAVGIARVLVGLEESAALPEDPVAFIRTHFENELPPIVKEQREDTEAAQQEHERLLAREAELSSQLAEACAALAAREAEIHAPLVDQLIALHADASDAAALDLSKLYNALAARFPPSPDAAWSSPEFQPPAGCFSRLVVDEWVRQSFCWGSALQKEHPELSLQSLLQLIQSGGAVAEPEMAAGIVAACVLLPTIECPSSGEVSS